MFDVDNTLVNIIPIKGSIIVDTITKPVKVTVSKFLIVLIIFIFSVIVCY